MIVTKLQGGLGNQLFQWAVTRYLSVKYNTDYKFELFYFQSMAWELELNKFKNISITLTEFINEALPNTTINIYQ